MTWTDAFIAITGLIVSGAIIGTGVIVWQACSMSVPESPMRQQLRHLAEMHERENRTWVSKADDEDS